MLWLPFSVWRQALAAVLLAALVNDLSRLSQHIVLVLDDYDSVAVGATHEFVTAWVDALPPTLRLIMTARASPPLPLARRRGRGELAEIRAVDLRSDETETPALLSAMLGALLLTTVVDAIQTRTEGWGGRAALGRAFAAAQRSGAAAGDIRQRRQSQYP